MFAASASAHLNGTSLRTSGAQEENLSACVSGISNCVSPANGAPPTHCTLSPGFGRRGLWRQGTRVARQHPCQFRHGAEREWISKSTYFLLRWRSGGVCHGSWMNNTLTSGNTGTGVRVTGVRGCVFTCRPGTLPAKAKTSIARRAMSLLCTLLQKGERRDAGRDACCMVSAFCHRRPRVEEREGC